MSTDREDETSLIFRKSECSVRYFILFIMKETLLSLYLGCSCFIIPNNQIGWRGMLANLFHSMNCYLLFLPFLWQCPAIDYTRHTLDGAACLLNSNKYFPSRSAPLGSISMWSLWFSPLSYIRFHPGDLSSSVNYHVNNHRSVQSFTGDKSFLRFRRTKIQEPGRFLCSLGFSAEFILLIFIGVSWKMNSAKHAHHPQKAAKL